ncbi:MAG: carbohydrate ABC transporter permease [Clostridiales bacterium]|jgi:multiple sugar transport system permease protein|nr:carbohydrate ABC transporter permease [Clostridiales bacterium]
MTETAAKKRRGRVSRAVKSTFSYAVLAAFALAFLIPFYIILITSFKATNRLATSTPFVWLPAFRDLGWDGYRNLFTEYTVTKTGASMVLTGVKNTFLVAVPVVFVGMLASCVSAYAFAKIDFRLKKTMFGALLFSMMLPGIVLLIPSFVIFDFLYLTDTFFPLIVPAMFGSAAGVFFLRQFFSGIPDELLDAGRIDGMGHARIFLQIMIPLSLPAILAQAVLGFIACYNDYLNPLIYLRQEEKYTLQIALQMFSGGNMTHLPTVMAGAVLALIPTIAVYLVAQKYFVAGITMSGLKA